MKVGGDPGVDAGRGVGLGRGTSAPTRQRPSSRPSAKGVTKQSAEEETRSSVPRVTQPSPTRIPSTPKVPPPLSPGALRPATMVAQTSSLPSFRRPDYIVAAHHPTYLPPHENDVSDNALNDHTADFPDDESVNDPLGLSNDAPTNSPLVKIHGLTPEEFARSQLPEVSIVQDVDNKTRLHPNTVASYLQNVFRLKHNFVKLLAMKWELVPESTKDFYFGEMAKSYKWRAVDEGVIYKAWDNVARCRYKQ